MLPAGFEPGLLERDVLLGLRPEALMSRFVRLVHAPAMGDQQIGKFIRLHISRHHLETPFMTGRRIHI